MLFGFTNMNTVIDDNMAYVWQIIPSLNPRNTSNDLIILIFLHILDMISFSVVNFKFKFFTQLFFHILFCIFPLFYRDFYPLTFWFPLVCRCWVPTIAFIGLHELACIIWIFQSLFFIVIDLCSLQITPSSFASDP